MGRKANGTLKNSNLLKALKPTTLSTFTEDSSTQVAAPKVTTDAKDIYKRYVDTGIFGAKTPPGESLIKYQNYANNVFDAWKYKNDIRHEF